MKFLKKTPFLILLFSITILFQSCEEETKIQEDSLLVIKNKESTNYKASTKTNTSKYTANNNRTSSDRSNMIEDNIPVYKYFFISYSTPFNISVINYLEQNNSCTITQNSTFEPNIFLIRIYCPEDEYLVYNTLTLFPNIVEEIIEPTAVGVTYYSSVPFFRVNQIREDFINDIYLLDAPLIDILTISYGNEIWLLNRCCVVEDVCLVIRNVYSSEISNDEPLQ